MSRLVAFMGSDPERLQAVLLEHRELLKESLPPSQSAKPSEVGESASLGIGFYQGGEVLLQRRPRVSGAPFDLCEALKDLRTDAFLAHLQTGLQNRLVKNENTSPYRFRSWLFAQQGAGFAPGFDRARDQVQSGIPDFLRRNVRGQTIGEHLFHYCLAALHEAGRAQIEDSNLPPERLLLAINAGLSRFGEALGLGPEGKSLGAVQIALTNGRALVVLRRGGEPLWLRRLSATTQGESLRGGLLLSGMSEDASAPLEQVPSDHAVLIGRDLNPRIVPLA